MSEDKGLIAVECISDFAVRRVGKKRHGGDGIVEHSAEDHPGVRRELTDRLDRPQRDAVPEIFDLYRHDLVKQLIGYDVRILAVTLSNSAPHVKEALLSAGIREEDRLVVLVQRVKGVPVSLVDIQYHMQAIFPAPPHTVVDILISFLNRFAVFRLYDRVIHRYADMVEAQPRDAPNVIFSDKGVKVLLCRSVELGEPAAEIDASHISIHSPHSNPLWLSSSLTETLRDTLSMKPLYSPL